MSVIVKGMEMPKDCNDCPCFEREWFNDDIVGFCKAIKLRIETYERLLNCPLIEIPPHGDLVDRDALIAEYDHQHKGPAGGARKIMEMAPTVIEAEGVTE